MTRSFFRAAVVWRLALLAAFWPVLAHGHAADDAVDAVVTVGRFVGVAITPADAPTVKVLVRCGLQGRTMLDCARSLVIEQLPPAAPAGRALRDAEHHDRCLRLARGVAPAADLGTRH